MYIDPWIPKKKLLTNLACPQLATHANWQSYAKTQILHNCPWLTLARSWSFKASAHSFKRLLHGF